MAEAIGLTASIIGIGELAAHAATVVLKLKDIWDQVKEAPDDISHMMLELKVLVSSLETIENQHNGVDLPPYNFDMSDMRQNLELCQHAAKQLSDMVTELALQSDTDSQFKRKMGAAKSMMKKDQIQKVKAKLSSSISLLKLCRETYTSTIQPHVLAYRLYKMFPLSQIIEKPQSLPLMSCQTSSITNPPPSVSSSSSSPNSFMIKYNQQASDIQSSLWVRGSKLLGIVEYETKTVALTGAQGDQKEMHDNVPYRTTQRSTRLRVQPPTWLLSKCWEALNHNIYGEWTFAFRTYNIVPYDAPVVKYIEKGDLSFLQNLFASKQATPFDRIIGSECRLLRVAIMSSRPDMCYFLMDLTKHAIQEQAFDTLLVFAILGTNFALIEYKILSRRLAAYINTSPEDICLIPSSVIRLVGSFYGDPAAFDAFITQFIPTHWNEPQRTRTISAINYASSYGIYNPDMLWKLLRLKDKLLDLEIAQTDYFGQGTLLHQCAVSLWEIVLDVTADSHGYRRSMNSGMPFFSLGIYNASFPPETIVSFYQDWASGPYEHWTSLRPTLLNKSSYADWNQRLFPKSQNYAIIGASS